jgi:hypothetical protein
LTDTPQVSINHSLSWSFSQTPLQWETQLHWFSLMSFVRTTTSKHNTKLLVCFILFHDQWETKYILKQFQTLEVLFEAEFLTQLWMGVVGY